MILLQGPIRTKPPRSGPPPLNKGLTKLMAELAKKSGAMDPRLAGNWEEIVGTEMAKLCRPVQTRSVGRARALEVAVANGAAAMQVQFRQDYLLQKLNTFFGKNYITRIQIRQTGKAGLRKPAKPAYSQPEIRPQNVDTFSAPKTSAEALITALERLKAQIDARSGE